MTQSTSNTNETTFHISYYADTTLPTQSCHKGIERFSTRRRSKWFPRTEKGIKEGMQFLKECKYPITKEKSLLFLKPKKEGIKIMNRINRKNTIKEELEKPTKLKTKGFIKLESFKDKVKQL